MAAPLAAFFNPVLIQITSLQKKALEAVNTLKNRHPTAYARTRAIGKLALLSFLALALFPAIRPALERTVANLAPLVLTIGYGSLLIHLANTIGEIKNLARKALAQTISPSPA
jgi:hypothetical protein